MVLIWWEYDLYHYSAWLQIPTGAKEPFPHRCCCYNQWNHSGIEGESVFRYCPNCLIWSVIWHYLFQKSKLKASKTQGCKDAYLCEKRRFKLSKRYREDESIVEWHWGLHCGKSAIWQYIICCILLDRQGYMSYKMLIYHISLQLFGFSKKTAFLALPFTTCPLTAINIFLAFQVAICKIFEQFACSVSWCVVIISLSLDARVDSPTLFDKIWIACSLAGGF